MGIIAARLNHVESPSPSTVQDGKADRVEHCSHQWIDLGEFSGPIGIWSTNNRDFQRLSQSLLIFGNVEEDDLHV